MSKIIISFCGEGRGHAARAISLIEELLPCHELVLMSFGEGYQYVESYIIANNLDIRLHKIHGVRYEYRGSRIAPVKTYVNWAVFMVLRIRQACKDVDKILGDFRPDLAIVDFEPCLARVARVQAIPCLSIDHQHFIRFCKLSILPPLLRIRAAIGSWVCRVYVPKADAYIVTTFFNPILRTKTKEQVILVGPIVRDAIKAINCSDGGFILSYLRKSMPKNVLNGFLTCGYPVYVYGLGKAQRIQNIEFKDISQFQFIRDLSAARAIVGAAGNQMISESLYLKKPYFALPEKDHHEQVMNSHFLKKMGLGDFCFLEDFNAQKLAGFLRSVELDEYRPRCENYELTANDCIKRYIENFIEVNPKTGGATT